jgi:protein-tyrosine-phosphatase
MQARLQSLLDENLFRVESAGFERKSLGRHRVHPSVVSSMQKRGIDIGKHQSHYIARLHHLKDYSVFVCAALCYPPLSTKGDPQRAGFIIL